MAFVDVNTLADLLAIATSEAADLLKIKRRTYTPGQIVLSTSVSVLETDDRTFSSSGGMIVIRLVSTGCLLLVLNVIADELRVLCLDTGCVGWLNTATVREYRC